MLAEGGLEFVQFLQASCFQSRECLQVHFLQSHKFVMTRADECRRQCRALHLCLQ